jgi:uncharacterized membrane protein
MTDANANTRLETFCDGVFAIAMTLLIIDIKLPPGEIHSTADLWAALRQLGPSVFAFVLSFCIILITWVNHHGALKLIRRSSAAFIFANGFFPTSLLGEFLLTDHAAPAVVLYDGVLALQSIAWMAMLGSALRGNLTIDAAAKATVHRNNRRGYFALPLYAGLALVAVWLPLAAAVVTAASWALWLTLAVSLKHE